MFLLHRLSQKDQHEAEGDFDLKVSRDDPQSDAYLDDDQQPIFQDGRRSPRRWFLPSPQGNSLFNNFCDWAVKKWDSLTQSDLIYDTLMLYRLNYFWSWIFVAVLVNFIMKLYLVTFIFYLPLLFHFLYTNILIKMVENDVELHIFWLKNVKKKIPQILTKYGSSFILERLSQYLCTVSVSNQS